ncbi:VTT domain-containing protein (plasmid) [Thioclava litoralis]|uniref:VTT domain-containing protein n=1 Tax=Thioclava litoralis TaxID=3076557 RepID=A0ABZ1E216_9RHOB|nr:VTT domain-containing protein [Thioclava sp. FTW29]
MTSISQLLPSIAALGMIGYWVIGSAAALEAFFLTGIFLPGTLVVNAGGVLVQQGVLDFFDLVWFVAIGSVLGGEATYWLGRHARRGMLGRWNVQEMPVFKRAEALFHRRGGMALVIGRFLGPVAAFVPFAAAMAGMERRKFSLWNLISGVPYAFVHVGIGYAIGAGLTKLNPVLTRDAAFAGGAIVLIAALWWTLRRLDRALPYLMSMAGGWMDMLGQHPVLNSWAQRHPRFARFIQQRLDRSHFGGLPSSILAMIALYLLSLGIGLAFDFIHAAPIVQIDARLAQLMQLFWTPGLIRFFTLFTALGDKLVVGLFLAIALLWLVVLRRGALIAGLFTALGSDLVSVILLKSSFARPRSALGYFTETSGSFPSGHATLSVAFYGMLFYLLWRLGRMGAFTAMFGAALIALLIGGSRLFLVEHYLSDVLAGWTLGGLCLILGVTIAEWLQRAPAPAMASLSGGLRAVALGLTVLLALSAGLRDWTYAKTQNPRPVPASTIEVSSVQDALAQLGQPQFAETLDGDHRFAMTLAFVAPDLGTLEQNLAQTGWRAAKPVTVAGLVKTGWGVLRDAGQPQSLAPLFWKAMPNDISFFRASETDSEVADHLRLWQSPYTTSSGDRIWVGTLTHDNGLDLEKAVLAKEGAKFLSGISTSIGK